MDKTKELDLEKGDTAGDAPVQLAAVVATDNDGSAAQLPGSDHEPLADKVAATIRSQK